MSLQKCIEEGERVLADTELSGRIAWYHGTLAFVRERHGNDAATHFAHAGSARGVDNRGMTERQLAVLCGLAMAGADSDVEDAIADLLDTFDAAALELRERGRNRPPLLIEDEYDVQYLLAALLRTRFREVVLEDPLPKNSGGSGRIDIHLSAWRTWIETKFARHGDTERKFRDEFAKDFELYRKGELDVLYCFVYDPERVLRNAREMERDLTCQRDKFETRVFVRP